MIITIPLPFRVELVKVAVLALHAIPNVGHHGFGMKATDLVDFATTAEAFTCWLETALAIDPAPMLRNVKPLSEMINAMATG